MYNIRNRDISWLDRNDVYLIYRNNDTIRYTRPLFIDLIARPRNVYILISYYVKRDIFEFLLIRETLYSIIFLFRMTQNVFRLYVAQVLLLYVG